MKRLFFALMMLCVGMLTQAQTIHLDHKFWDGDELYKVKEIRMGKYFYMTTSQDNELTLEKVDGKQGEYKLIPSRQAEECPFGAQYGWRVQHITQEGQSFLAVRKPNGDVMWVMDQTTDNEETCEYKQQMMGQEEPWNAVNSILLNRAYLRSNVATKAELRLLRNKILAYHGYRFQSKDLQEHFGKMAWYKPVDDNSTIKLDIIEQTNIQLIKSEEAERDENQAGAFVEEFYKEWDKRDLLDYGFVKQHITPNLLKYLADEYDYDCEGECLATWKFFYEGGGDVSGLKSRQITARDGSHVLVENNYENYEYDVLLTLVKDGDTFKIDSLKQEKSEYK